jgi:hypothetical protein
VVSEFKYWTLVRITPSPADQRTVAAGDGPDFRHYYVLMGDLSKLLLATLITAVIVTTILFAFKIVPGIHPL